MECLGLRNVQAQRFFVNLEGEFDEANLHFNHTLKLLRDLSQSKVISNSETMQSSQLYARILFPTFCFPQHLQLSHYHLHKQCKSLFHQDSTSYPEQTKPYDC